ncbi:hypothetical protein OGAPHI_005263 [Ogataea philodendri]|uniref:Uncharacterized protein n=1 Tax=Ogataea philodendri TaxID=1378263 RepID=A0A9P8T3C4_9ASCO|nr:uncharacterized protein OGAPHI_005263 [Ogataea philodendri]KAH3663860.1 hypothetical protein OGAPHI_005263 [Ogataea philodendri]
MSLQQTLEALEARVVMLEAVLEGSGDVNARLNELSTRLAELMGVHDGIVDLFEKARQIGLHELVIRPADTAVPFEDKYRVVVANLKSLDSQLARYEEIQQRLDEWDGLFKDVKTREAVVRLVSLGHEDMCHVLDGLGQLKKRFYTVVLNSTRLIQLYMANTLEQTTFYMDVETRLRRCTQLVEQRNNS